MINRYYKKNKIEIEFQKIKNNQILGKHLKMCKNNRQKAMNITTVKSDVIPSTSRGSNDAIMINSDDECPNRDNEYPECPICLTQIDEERWLPYICAAGKNNKCSCSKMCKECTKEIIDSKFRDDVEGTSRDRDVVCPFTRGKLSNDIYNHIAKYFMSKGDKNSKFWACVYYAMWCTAAMNNMLDDNMFKENTWHDKEYYRLKAIEWYEKALHLKSDDDKIYTEIYNRMNVLTAKNDLSTIFGCVQMINQNKTNKVVLRKVLASLENLLNENKNDEDICISIRLNIIIVMHLLGDSVAITEIKQLKRQINNSCPNGYYAEKMKHLEKNVSFVKKIKFN